MLTERRNLKIQVRQSVPEVSLLSELISIQDTRDQTDEMLEQSWCWGQMSMKEERDENTSIQCFVNGQCYKNCFQWKVYWFGSQTLIYPTALNVYKSVTNVWTNSVCIIVLAYVFTLKGSNSQIVKIYIVVI